GRGLETQYPGSGRAAVPGGSLIIQDCGQLHTAALMGREELLAWVFPWCSQSPEEICSSSDFVPTHQIRPAWLKLLIPKMRWDRKESVMRTTRTLFLDLRVLIIYIGALCIIAKIASGHWFWVLLSPRGKMQELGLSHWCPGLEPSTTVYRCGNLDN
ncbi:unnamed protein product, partial [Gulo gulo]